MSSVELSFAVLAMFLANSAIINHAITYTKNVIKVDSCNMKLRYL